MDSRLRTPTWIGQKQTDGNHRILHGEKTISICGQNKPISAAMENLKCVAIVKRARVTTMALS